MEVTTYVILQAVITIIALNYFYKFELNFAIFGFNILLMSIITFFSSLICFTSWGSNDFESSEDTGLSSLIYLSLVVEILSFGSNFVLEYKIKAKDIKKNRKIGYRVLYEFSLVLSIIISYYILIKQII